MGILEILKENMKCNFPRGLRVKYGIIKQNGYRLLEFRYAQKNLPFALVKEISPDDINIKKSFSEEIKSYYTNTIWKNYSVKVFK